MYPPQHGRELAVDEHGRIGGRGFGGVIMPPSEPYVDFQLFYELWNQRNGVAVEES